MSSSGFSELIQVRPDDRAVTGAMGAAVGLLAASGIAMADMPAGVRLLALLLTAAGVVAGTARHWRDSWRVERAVLRCDGTWHLRLGDSSCTDAVLTHAWGRTSGPLVGLAWRTAGGRRCKAWLWRRATHACTWRRLRVRLRLA